MQFDYGIILCTNAVSYTHLHFFCGDCIQFSSVQPWIHKGIKTYMGNGGPARCNIPVHLGYDALGQVIGLHLIFQSQFLQSARQVPVTADGSGEQPFFP